jgi:hypothetical protein
MRRRTAKKRVMKRQTVKGGAYQGVGNTYNRFKDGTEQILYKLTSEKEGNYTRYILDFTASTATFTGIPDLVIKKKYKSVFTSAFNVTDQGSIANIDNLIENLFIGGITNGVKRRKIVLTDQMDGNVIIQLLEGADEKFNAVIKKDSPNNDMFDGFLRGLGDEIMLEGQSKPVKPSRFSNISSFFGSRN